jgi:hypothetical protein
MWEFGGKDHTDTHATSRFAGICYVELVDLFQLMFIPAWRRIFPMPGAQFGAEPRARMGIRSRVYDAVKPLPR